MRGDRVELVVDPSIDETRAEFKKRPALFAMLNGVDDKAFDVVVMRDETRFGGDMNRAGILIQDLIDSGCRLFYYYDDHEVTLDDPSAKLMIAVRNYTAEVERLKISQRTREHLMVKARRGLNAGGKAYGYRNVRNGGAGGWAAPVSRKGRDGPNLERGAFEYGARPQGDDSPEQCYWNSAASEPAPNVGFRHVVAVHRDLVSHARTAISDRSAALWIRPISYPPARMCSACALKRLFRSKVGGIEEEVDLDRLLPAIWNWLPAFRAVAESEHLPTASKILNVTPGALSRSIRQLEDALGQQLFTRAGRKLVLNTAGARLLVAINEATGTLDGALASITSEPLAGPARISSLGVLTNEFVLPALLALKRAHPRFVPILENRTQRESNELLVRGHLDVAFYYDAVAHEGLSIDSIGTATAHVHCGRGHPLFDAGEVTLEQLLAHAFSVPRVGDNGLPMDGWPIDVPREIGMQITLLTTNLHVCLSGQLLTVLPDVVAEPHVGSGRLRRFPFDLVAPIPLFAARRELDDAGTSAALIIEAVRSVVSSTNC